MLYERQWSIKHVDSLNRNPIWDYFRRDVEKGVAQCLICREWKIFKNHKYTTNLISHLSSKQRLHCYAYVEFNRKRMLYSKRKSEPF
ncbi:hypothetical protein Phum_PHUM132230 [Pediculus humanus corporis]|uniref:BED-type domain-containing protein n=1 Tax=Pediculus humanus subsp. corporis TaxID=121224 RepID=E0VEG5_PEDHC|nr:uncharacterized protein Phum_PHUM132230 [Pediculus humanus corporis]EEB11771.1 hypothetical protein Phum_PHUM132230 [Pediculus humanus corporis]